MTWWPPSARPRRVHKLFTNGFTREQLWTRRGRVKQQVAEEFNAWASATFSGPPIVAGMNVTFDVNFMGELYRRTGTVFGLRSRFLDVQDVAIFLHTAGLIELPYSGSFLRTNLGALLLTLTPGAVRSEKHTCFEDVWLTRNVYGAMLNKAARGG